MKIALFHIVLAMTCGIIAAKEGSDFRTPGGKSHLLKYKIALHSSGSGENAKLAATLTNVSGQDLRVQVNSEDFFGTLLITNANGKRYEAFDKEYFALLLTGSWMNRTVNLDANKSIHWTVPIKRLRTDRGKRITFESLAGAVIGSEMNMAVVPNRGSSIGNNARQTSKPIRIKKERLTLKSAAKSPREW